MKALLETLNSGADYLAKRQIEDSRLNMEHLLAHVLGCRRLDLYLRFDQVLDEGQLQPLRSLLKRRGEGVPLQHLLGSVPFHGHEFVSDSRALIPRPETEHLVHLLADKRLKNQSPARALDVGAGSGCIGLSLAKQWPQCRVTLVDVSEDALELARLNAHRLGLEGANVSFFRSDLFEELGGERFDLVVANLPYIPTAEMNELSREVLHDPHLALDGGADGLDIIRRLIDGAPGHMNSHALMALELHHDQAGAVANLLQAAGFTDIQRAQDLSGIERFVFAQAPEVVETPPADVTEAD